MDKWRLETRAVVSEKTDSQSATTEEKVLFDSYFIGLFVKKKKRKKKKKKHYQNSCECLFSGLSPSMLGNGYISPFPNTCSSILMNSMRHEE